MALARKLISALKKRLGSEAVLTSTADLYVHGFDATAAPTLPDIVVRPGDAGALAWACETLWRAGVPVTPRGAGTGFSGGAVPARGGAVIVCDRLKNVTAPADGKVTVGPGVVGDDLNSFLARYGLFYPVDPASADASTIGGHVAENAGGPRALKYGVTRDYVQAVRILSPARGREVVAATPARPDRMGILVGSEGTLAVFLDITLRVLPLPAASATAAASFRDVVAAACAADAVLKAGVLPAKMEFLDKRCIFCVNAVRPAAFDAGAEAVLLLECDGSPAAVAEEIETTAQALRSAGAVAVTRAEGAAAARLWANRRGVSAALGILAPHKLNEDVCVPRSQVPALLKFIRELEDDYGLRIPTFGHIGDGNLHVNFMFHRGQEGAAARADAAAAALMAEVVRVGGTISGEHGVGLAKARFLPLEWSEGAYRYARAVKSFYDPAGLLNPGKIFGAGPGDGRPASRE